VDARGIIAALRDGRGAGPEAMAWFARGLADGRVSDAQAGAFAMAVVLRGLDAPARTALTLAMRDSGRVLDWPEGAPVLDKHSTGGVGDCASLPLAPALAACGAVVPMVSGRGLGHTGGTLDKLEAIPGFVTALPEDALRAVVRDVGCAIVSAGPELAPADRRLYAIRDVTATVESLDLITASILSKKLAAGLGGLVLDVKTGSGAFMKGLDAARALARSLVDTANAAGCRTSALITDMSQPLAPEMGNALEVAASMRVLTGQAAGPLAELTVALGGQALADAGLAGTPAAGEAAIAAALADGRAAERFGRMVAAQGGAADFVERWQRLLPVAPVVRDLPAAKAGFVAAMDGEAMGLAVIGLGGGRQVETDRVDPAVGLSDIVRLGTRVERGDPLLRIHAACEEAATRAARTLGAAIHIGEDAPAPPPLIHERLG